MGKNKGGRLLAAFALPVLLCLMILALFGQYPFGNHTLLIWDMNWQYSSFLVHLHDILHGEASAWYTFSRAIGGDMYGVGAYYLFSPYNLLFYFFDEQNLYAGVLVVLLLKIGSMGLTMNLYLQRKNTSWETLLFSTAYAGSAFVAGYFHNIMWLDALIVLPLMVLGIERLFDEGKSFLYIFSIAYAVMTNFYMGYMLCLFSVLYAVVYFFFLSNGKKRFLSVVRYAFSSLAGGGLAGIVIFPVQHLLQSGKTGENGFDLTQLSDWSKIYDFADIFTNSFAGTMPDRVITGNGALIYCGVLSVILLILLLFLKCTWKKKLGYFLLIGVMWLSMMHQNLYVMWHGFSMPMGSPHRFSFLYSFLVLVAAEHAYRIWGIEQESGESRKRLLAGVIVTGGLLLCGCLVWSYHFTGQGHKGNFVLNLCLIVGYLGVLFFFRNKKLRAGILTVMMCAELLVNAGYLYTYSTQFASATVDEFDQYVEQTGELVERIREDGDWYRAVLTEESHRTGNDSFLWNLYGLDSYTSVEQDNVHQIALTLGYQNSMGLGIHYEEGSTVAAESFLGVRYRITSETQPPVYTLLEEQQGSELKLYQNTGALPLAMYVKPEMYEVCLDLQNVFSYQNELYQNLLTDRDEEVLAETERILDDTINCTQASDGTFEVTDYGQDAYAVYRIPIIMEGNYYIQYMNYYGRNVTAIVNGNYVDVTREGNRIVNLGYLNPEDELLLQCEVINGDVGELFQSVYLYGEDDRALADYAEDVRNQSLEILCEKDDTIIVKTGDDGEDYHYVMFNIPYDEGWSATVDGKTAWVNPTYGGFFIVEAPEGEHEIALTYRTTGLKQGVCVSAVTAEVLLLLYLWKRLSAKRKIDRNKQNAYNILNRKAGR